MDLHATLLCCLRKIKPAGIGEELTTLAVRSSWLLAGTALWLLGRQAHNLGRPRLEDPAKLMMGKGRGDWLKNEALIDGMTEIGSHMLSVESI
jgi:hypothetical protein